MAKLPPIKQGLKQLKKIGNIGTRIPFHRFGTFNNTTQNTFLVVAALASRPEFIRPIFATTNAALSNYVTPCKMSVMANLSDIPNNGGTWVDVTCNSQTAYPLELAPVGGSGNRVGYTLPDFIQLRGVDRDDGGEYYLVAIRAYFGADSALPVYGNGTDDLTNWATNPDGRIWIARNVASNQITVTNTWPTSGAGATNQSQSPIIGIQYISEGQVLTVGSLGDSIMEGAGGTYFGANYTYEACKKLHDKNKVAIEVANFGWSGQRSDTESGFHARAMDILNNDELRPDVMVLESGSMNDPAPLVTSTIASNWKANTEKVVERAIEVGTVPIVTTVMATSYAAHPVGSSDSLRLAHNAYILDKYNARGIDCVDVATPLAGAVEAHGQEELNPALCDVVGAHPNDAGKALLVPVLAPVIKKVAGL